MSHLIFFLTTIYLSTVTGKLSFLGKLTQGLTNEFNKGVIAFGSGQCKNVKRIFGVDYDSYNDAEPDLSKLTLNFITRGVNQTYKLTEGARILEYAPWCQPRLPLKIYLHGFLDDPTLNSYSALNDAFMRQGDCNILALDASSLIRWIYLRASTMVRFIGTELGKLLVTFFRAGLPPSGIHLIGHSLGSHIAGFAGKAFTAATKLRVGRITGLDPAGPCFSNTDPTLRLNRDDADFVDVIHTDAGVYGIDEYVGHADFYPNGGSKQPECLSLLPLATCSHSRAWLLFAESVINQSSFLALHCWDWETFKKGGCSRNSVSKMGYHSVPGTKGTYYLQTAGEYPFGLGQNGLTYVNNDGFIKSLGDEIANIIG